MVELGTRLAAVVTLPLLIYLEGELGAGKTTLARGVARGLGHGGAVKSPTYTLVEPYELPGVVLYHFDLYRLGDPEELEFMGIRDYFHERSLCLVEWPQRGAGLLPPPDIVVSIEIAGRGRQVSFEGHSLRGVECLQRLSGEPEIKNESGVQ